MLKAEGFPALNHALLQPRPALLRHPPAPLQHLPDLLRHLLALHWNLDIHLGHILLLCQDYPVL